MQKNDDPPDRATRRRNWLLAISLLALLILLVLLAVNNISLEYAQGHNSIFDK